VNFAGIRSSRWFAKLDILARVVALTMIDGNTPVRSDTRSARFQFQGLRGIASDLVPG